MKPTMAYNCKRCGMCCRVMTVSGWDELTRDRLNYIKDITAADGSTHIVMEAICKHLTKDNKCSIHGTCPQRCKDFPRGEEGFWKLINPDCGMI